MPHIECVKNNGKPYLRLAESRYVKDIGRQKKFVIKNLGPLSKFDDGKPDFLKRFREKFKNGEIDFDGITYYSNLPTKRTFEIDNDMNYIELKNIGFLFLQSVYNSLGISQLLNQIKSDSKIEYDLNGLTKMLVFGRILDPQSKKKTFEDREKSILIGDMNRVSYDYFPGISDKEFLKALHYMGFIIDLHQKVNYGSHEVDPAMYGYFTFAHDPKTNVVVTSDSFGKGKIITRAEVFCPALICNKITCSLITRRSGTVTVFSLTADDLHGINDQNTGIIHTILKSMKKAVENGTNVFDGSITPSIWGSREPCYENEDLESDVFHRQALEFDKDTMMELFKNDPSMMRIFSTVH